MRKTNHKPKINICWLRRDLRLTDHAALYHALKSDLPTLVLFIFDKNILAKLTNKTDARVDFIHQQVVKINEQLAEKGSCLLVKFDTPAQAWEEVLEEFEVNTVFANHDYEPYAKQRDDALAALLKEKEIRFNTYKDQVIFEKSEIQKADGKPYTVFTPYYKQWHAKLNDFYLKPYPTANYFGNLFQCSSALPIDLLQKDSVLVNDKANLTLSQEGTFKIPTLNELGFSATEVAFPSTNYEDKLEGYESDRDFPAKEATTRLGLHLRFGTVSIRQVAQEAIDQKADKWLSELAWREFYMMILWHFPHTVNKAFKPAYDRIVWRNNEQEFDAWCKGETGYPLVDAGMKQLNTIGFMHNRVRMVTASFLCKHLLIDWRWGEAYFAEKLLDYEQASNVGGWQWACGSGNDAAPYFRIFNPALQLKKFDPKMEYVFQWAPIYKKAMAPIPIVVHEFARTRVLAAFKKALTEEAS